MSRIRGLKPDFFKDEDLAALPFEARLLFQGLWCLADREGRLEDRPKYIQAEIFPYDKKINIENLLTLLCLPKIEGRPGKIFIRRYQVDGRKYINIPEFLKHQKPHHTEKDSLIPAYEAKYDIFQHVTEDNRYLTVKQRLQDGKSQEESVHCSLLMEKEKEKDSVEHGDGLPGRPPSNRFNFTEQAKEILTFLNQKVKRNYQPVEANINFITARLKEGATTKQCRQVIAKKARDWLDDPKMNQYLRPATLFNKTKFAQYVGELFYISEEEPT